MPNELRGARGSGEEEEDPIAVIQATLRKYPQARFQVTPRRVTVFPIDGDGFQAVFQELGRGRYRISCAGWHEEFGHVGEALDCFTSGLSSACRLKVWARGSVDYKWQMEVLKEGRWAPHSVTGSLLFPFWRKLQTRYLQNRLLEAA